MVSIYNIQTIEPMVYSLFLDMSEFLSGYPTFKDFRNFV